jgi:hypothetical protein
MVLSSIAFDTPSRIRELRHLPLFGDEVCEVPDSIEILHLETAGPWQSRYTVKFGRDSKLYKLAWDMAPHQLIERFEDPHKRGFLHVSSHTLKTFRLITEFDPDGISDGEF